MSQNANKTASHKEKVYRYVKEGIISHAFLAGEMLHERSLAEALGVSRTPVREALQALQDDGWLTVVPRKGTMVRPLKRADVEEVLQLRRILGTVSVEHAARLAGPTDVAYFTTLIGAQEEAARNGDFQAFMAADMKLHLAFVRFAGNRRMFAFAENLCDYFQRMGICALTSQSSSFSQAIQDHKNIVRAVAERDADRAKKLLTEHIEATRTVLLRYLAEGRSSDSPADMAS
ncbi:MAG: Fatty acid metabolism regulator protein [Desulfovibrio sp.]